MNEWHSKFVRRNRKEESSTPKFITFHIISCPKVSTIHPCTVERSKGEAITIENIVVAINSGLARGQRRYNNVVVRSVLSLLRTKPEWSNSILDLAIELKDQGVVGIDMAGDILGITSAPNEGDVKNGI